MLKSLVFMVDIAGALGHQDDAAEYMAMAKRSAAAFVQAYLRLDADRRITFADGSLTHQGCWHTLECPRSQTQDPTKIFVQAMIRLATQARNASARRATPNHPSRNQKGDRQEGDEQPLHVRS